MPNLAQAISSHNNKILQNVRNVTTNDDVGCNCRNPDECPLDGSCKISSVIYQAAVTTCVNPVTTETYVGLTGGQFKTRFNSHNYDIRNSDEKVGTALSTHINDLKKAGKSYEVKWRILDRGKTYVSSTKICRLCLLEKHHIMFNSECASLNKRSEVFSSCRHRSRLKLGPPL